MRSADRNDLNLYLFPIDRSGRPAVDQSLPELIRDICLSCRLLYDEHGFRLPWVAYLARNESGDIVGTCAFKAPPQRGRVAIACYTLPEFEGQGVAQTMVRELMAIAAARDPHLAVVAHTQPEQIAANHALKRLGFSFAGMVNHPEEGPVWEWQWRAAVAAAMSA